METNQHPAGSESRFDTQGGALIGRASESSSLIDQLMEMPLPVSDGGSEAPEWDAAVSRRMERRLSQALRALLEDEPRRRSA